MVALVTSLKQHAVAEEAGGEENGTGGADDETAGAAAEDAAAGDADGPADPETGSGPTADSAPE